jgi:putative phosphoribosyl transferase
MMFSGFSSREDAGRQLARKLKGMDLPDPVILALPRGGVPVAAEVARALNAPLDVLLVRKIGVPWQPELAAAAIVDGESPDLVLNDSVMRTLDVKIADIEALSKHELEEIERRRKLYVGDRQPVSVRGRTAIVVDDGIATGTTATAALKALRRREPKSIVLAVPVGSPDSISRLREHADQVICMESPSIFYAIGQFYSDFHQLSDEEVIGQLQASATREMPRPK